MNDLVFAFIILSAVLGVTFLVGGIMVFRDLEKDERSAWRFGDLLLFGAMVSTIYDIATNWRRNREGRICICFGIGFLIVAGILGLVGERV